MRLLITTGFVLTAAFVATLPTTDLAAAGKPVQNIKVIVSFHDRGGDRIMSDGGGAYQDGVGSVVAYLATSTRALTFGANTSNRAGRTLQYIFDACLSVLADCDAPWGSLNEKSGLLANVLRDGVVPAGGMLSMAVGETLSMWIKFNIPLDTDPAYWNVCYDSRRVVGPCAAPGGTSTDAHIRRDATDQWTVFANNSGDRGDLIRDSDTAKSRTYTHMGTYSMPFEFTVQCINAAECP